MKKFINVMLSIMLIILLLPINSMNVKAGGVQTIYLNSYGNSFYCLAPGTYADPQLIYTGTSTHGSCLALIGFYFNNPRTPLNTIDQNKEIDKVVLLLNVANHVGNPILMVETSDNQELFNRSITSNEKKLEIDVTNVVKQNLSNDRITFNLKGSNTATNTLYLYTDFYDRTVNTLSAKLLVSYKQNFPPTDISLTNTSIRENLPIGSLIGTLTTTDPNPVDKFTYSLTSGDTAYFEIDGGTLKTKAILDYETKSSYSVEIQVTDYGGNTFKKIFTLSAIDVNEAPTGSLAINAGATHTNSTDVTLNVTATDQDANDTLEVQFSNDNVTWSSWEPLMSTNSWQLPSGDGVKTVYMQVRDRQGLVSHVYSDTITLDTTVPTVTGITNGAIVSQNVTIAFNEGTATLNGNSFSNGDTVTVEGAYNLIVTDTASNNTTIAFTIDKTAPVVTGIQNGAIVNNDVTITFNEGTATLNGNPFSSGDTVTDEGAYSLVVTDAAKNTTTIAFTIDKNAPVVTGIQNGDIVNKDVAITFNKGTATLNNNPFSSGDTVTVEGAYNLIVTDDAGNNTTIAFTIDKTAPIITINGVENNKTYQQVTPIITANDAQTTMTTTLERDGTPVPFTQGSVISQTGSYTLIVKATDLAGNETTETVSFSIYVPSPAPEPIVTPPSPPTGPVEPWPIETLPRIEIANANLSSVLTNGSLRLFQNGQPVPIVATETIGGILLVQTGQPSIGQTSPIHETGEVTFQNSIRRIFVIGNEVPFRYFDTATNVSPQKEWNIRFLLPVNTASVNFENIVVKDAKGNVIETELQLSEDRKTIKVIPKHPYKKGEIYYLTINGLQSENGEELKEQIRKIFIITQ